MSWLLANSVAMNIGVHVSFGLIVFSGYMPRSGIAESHGKSIFSFIRNLHAVFHRGCTNLYYYQQCTKIPCFPHPHQPLLLLAFLMTAPSKVICSFVVLICILQMTKDIEHIFMCLLAICMPSLEKCLFTSSAHF